MASSLASVRPYAARLLPILAIGAILALSWFVGNRVVLNPRLVACVGYGSSYGYAGGPPTVTGVIPTAGPTSGGTTVNITGKGYCGGTAAPSAVTFGGTAATSFAVNSDTSITAISPAHTAGTVDVQVTTSNGASGTNAGDQFTYGAFTSYFQWFDKASPGMLNDNIHLLNTSGSAATVTVSLDATDSVTVAVANNAEALVTFPQGTIGGPVTVNSDQPIKASQRVQYYQSFNEVWAETAAQASTVSYFNWYDKASPGMFNDNIHLYNPGTTSATVTVTLGSTSQHATVAPGTETLVGFAQGSIGGQVTVSSTVPVLASQRVQYFSSFNEVWSEPASMAATTQYVNWYDKASPGMLNDNVHLFNPGVSSAFVTIYLPDGTAHVTMVPAGSEGFVSLPQGSIGGPLTITSSQAVLASQRVQYFQSFNEIWGETAGQGLTTGYFNWYDKASPGVLNDNIHVFNLGTSSATVMVTVGTNTQTVTVAAGSGSIVTFAQGTIGGPVKVTSSQPALISQRVQWYQSFNEIWAM